MAHELKTKKSKKEKKQKKVRKPKKKKVKRFKNVTNITEQSISKRAKEKQAVPLRGFLIKASPFSITVSCR